jgi:hypothetical protein
MALNKRRSWEGEKIGLSGARGTAFFSKEERTSAS